MHLPISEEESTSAYDPDDATPRTHKTHLVLSLNFQPTSSEDEVVNEDPIDCCSNMQAAPCISQMPVQYVEDAKSQEGTVTSRRRPVRGSRNFSRLLAEAAKTARVIREQEMARRQLLREQMSEDAQSVTSQRPFGKSSGVSDPGSEVVNQSDMAASFAPQLGVPVVAAQIASPFATCAVPDIFPQQSKQGSGDYSLRKGSRVTEKLYKVRSKGGASKRRDMTETLAPASGNNASFSVAGEDGLHKLEPSCGRSTLMMRNIPNNYTRSMLLELLDHQGFAGKYDFLYLPIDFKTNLSLGYAFVNLCMAFDVDAFHRCFSGFKNWAMPSRKVCEVAWGGPQQGLKANIDRYQSSPVMHDDVADECKPVILLNGQRVAFPRSTTKIRAPRVRRYAFVSIGACDSVGKTTSRQQVACNDSRDLEDAVLISGDEACWI